MDERGSVLPAILALAFGGLLLFGVAIDLTRWAGNHREVAFAADAGAQAGAAMVSEEELRSGRLVVDAGPAHAAATQAARGSRPGGGRSIRVTVSDDQVCVEVEQPFSFGAISILPIDPAPVRARSCANPARG